MGTDIHLYIERQDDNGNWGRVRPSAWPCPFCGGKGELERYDKTMVTCFSCAGKRTTTEEYGCRNYNLFAMLANVRNGHGFAGCDTGDGFVPLAEPRGLPADTSIHDTADEYEDPAHVWLGDHSFSHCTLAEALTYDYSRMTKHRGTLNAREYVAWVEKGRKGYPNSYCGGVGGMFVRTVDHAEMDRLIRVGAIDLTVTDGPFHSPTAGDGFTYYTVVEWESSYRESAGKEWFDFLDACRLLGDPAKIRFVFGFDS